MVKTKEQTSYPGSAETPYRTFIEEMNEGAVTLSKDGRILYCNQRFGELVNESVDHVIGSYFNKFLVSDDKTRFDCLFAQKVKNKNSALIVSLLNSLYIKLSIHLLPDSLQAYYCILIATDISEIRKDKEKLLELHHSLEQKLDIIQRLRMQLIDKKIELNAEIKKLKTANQKLVKEITGYKVSESARKQQIKMKQKKSVR